MLKDLLLKLTAVLFFVSMTTMAFAQGATCDMAEVVTPGDYALTEAIPPGGNSQGNATGAVWYSYTPDATGLININACLGGADTRLIIWTGACDALVNVGFNDDACEVVEGGDAYASGIENFIVEAGITYLIEWDDRWDATAFSWTFEFVSLPAVDLASSLTTPYLNIPAEQAANPITFNGSVGNFGANAITGVHLVVNVYDAADPATIIGTVSSDTVDLPGFQEVAGLTASWMAPEGSYLTNMTVMMNETEDTPEMHTTSGAFNIGGVTYSAETGRTGGLGIPGGVIVQGQIFDFYSDAEIFGATLDYAGAAEGDTLEFRLYNVVNGLPDTVAYSQMLAVEGSTSVSVTIDGNFPVAAGSSYYAALYSSTVEANIGLGFSEEFFYPGKAFYQINGGNWTPLANFASASYVIRLLTGIDPVAVTFQVDMSQETVSADGIHIAGSFNNWDPAATMMTDAGNGLYTATITALPDDVVTYQFINGNTLDAGETVPVACGVDNGEGVLNRSFTAGLDDSTVPVACFASCSACSLAPFPGCAVSSDVSIDDLELYTAGESVSAQSFNWAPWPGGTSALVSTEQAQSGVNSVHILDGGGLDQVYVLPSNLTTGTYSASWSLFVPTDAGAYYNLQADNADIGGEFKIEVNMPAGGTGSISAGNVDTEFDYPHDTWFVCEQIIDLDNDIASLTVNGTVVHTWIFSWQSNDMLGGTSSFGAVNFFPINDTYNFFVDDVAVVCSDTPPAFPGCDDVFTTVNADNIDSYTTGESISDQSNNWSPWPGGTSANVSSDQAQSGANSVHILDGGGLDQVYTLPSNLTTGTYSASWSLFVPTDAGAYYNLQADRNDIGGEFKIEVNMPAGGTGSVSAGNIDTEFDYPHDTWFVCEQIINLDEDYAVLMINGVQVHSWTYSWQSNDMLGGTSSFGAVNFFPINDTYNFFVDDVNVICSELTPPVEQVDLTVSVSTQYMMVEADGMFLTGSFNGWTDMAMTDMGGDLWSATVSVDPNMQYEYKYKNGANGLEDNTLAGDCVQGADFNRFVDVGVDAVDMSVVCFETCAAECVSGTIDLGFDANINVSPNPSNGQFRLSYDLDNAADLSITVSNILGQVISIRTVNNAVSGSESFDMTDVPAGTYSIVITDGELLSTKRIIIE